MQGYVKAYFVLRTLRLNLLHVECDCIFLFNEYLAIQKNWYKNWIPKNLIEANFPA